MTFSQKKLIKGNTPYFKKEANKTATLQSQKVIQS